jgi:hypothetical protein
MSQVITDKSGKGGQAAVAWVLAILTLGYMLPWAIAATRGKSNAGAIGWINLLLGWTLIGWIIALVMACGSHQAAGIAPVPVAAAPVTPTTWVDPATGRTCAMNPATGQPMFIDPMTGLQLVEPTAAQEPAVTAQPPVGQAPQG